MSQRIAAPIVLCVLLAWPSAGRAQGSKAIPSEFLGVWIDAGVEDNQCKKDDWKGKGASKNDRIFSVAPSVIEEWESRCEVMLVRNMKTDHQEGRTTEVSLACGGEGMTWRTSEVWHVRTIDQRRLLVQTRRILHRRDDGGRPMRVESNLAINISLECK